MLVLLERFNQFCPFSFAVVVEVTGHAHVLLAAFEKVNEGVFYPSVPVLVYVNISTGH